ncbi:MAG: PilZ domain-containing protein [Terriglobales bacterium]
MARKKTTHNSAERRSRLRFRIGQDISYKCLSGKRLPGVGKVLDISSHGVSFTTDDTLNPGTPIELSVNWPALLDHTCLLKLMVYGCVVRSEANAAAIRIEHYEFRTRATQVLPVLPEPLRHPKEV